MRRCLCTLAAAVLPIALSAAAAVACVPGPSREMPQCQAPQLNAKAHAVIVSGDSITPTNLRFGDEGPPALLQDIEIAQGSGPLHLVLSSYNPTIYRFSGAVEEIWRVTVLGASGAGSDYFGIVGLPAAKVLSTPVTSAPPPTFDHCNRAPLACVPSQFFSMPGSHAGLPAPHYVIDLGRQPRHTPAVSTPIVIRRDPPVTQPAQPAEDFEEFKKRWAAMSDPERYHENTPAEVRLEVAGVYSPRPLVADDLPISWDGITELQRQGLIHGRGSAKYREVFERWIEETSAELSTPLDPNYRFSAEIDYVVTGAIRVPRELRFNDGRQVAFLVASGAPAPLLDWRSGRGACLFFFHRPIPDCSYGHSDEVIQARSSAIEALRYLEKAIASPWPPNRTVDKCRATQIPADARVVAIATFSGVDEENPKRLGLLGCLRSSSSGSRCPEGRVDVIVKRPGPVFLVLDAHRPVNWHISAGSDTKVVGALNISAFKHEVFGLPDGIRLQQPEPQLLGQSPCHRMTPVHAYLGGPNATLLDQAVLGIAGRRIDQFLNRPTYPGKLGERIPSIELKEYSRFIVE